MALPNALLQATKRVAGFGGAVVDVLGNCGIVRDDAAKVCEVLNYVKHRFIKGDVCRATCSMWRMLVQHFCFLQADCKTKNLCCLSKAIDDCLESSFIMGKKCAVICKKQLQDQHFHCFSASKKSSEVEYALNSPKPYEDPFCDLL